MSFRAFLTIFLALLLVHVLFFAGLFWWLSRAQIVNFTLQPKKTSFHEGVSPASGHDTSRLVKLSSEDCAALRGIISPAHAGATLSAGCCICSATASPYVVKQCGASMTPTLPADSFFFNQAVSRT